MGREVVIIHFQPLELYPPVMNLLTFIAREYSGEEVTVYTTSPGKKDVLPFQVKGGKISIRRIASIDGQQGAFSRYLNYLLFCLGSLFGLLRIRPGKVLYFESLSSFPAWCYKKFFNRKVAIFIHYHEYTSLPEYEAGMKLNRYFHKKEGWLYTRAAWISHTNPERISLFLKDLPEAGILPVHVLPNYPSRSWARPASPARQLPVRVVYVGALSMDTMYTGTFTDWILAQDGKVTWHIYSRNMSVEAADYFKGIRSEYIKLMPGMDYDNLPSVLAQYDAGVILYNGHIPNYVFNAPNKLFEYLACGLDVWFPEIMRGCGPYITSGTYPKVLPIDFSRLEKFQPEAAADITGLRYEQPRFCYEEVLPELTGRLFTH